MSEEMGTSPKQSSSGSSDVVAIVAVIATGIVVLACVVACTVVAYAFLNNPPWGFMY